MKIFIAVVLAATVIGGFVGAEIMDSSFSITGAVVAGVGTLIILLGLGAFFDAQERKRKEKALPPEMRGVFDRMTGKNTSSRQQPSKPSPRQQSQRTVAPAKGGRRMRQWFIREDEQQQGPFTDNDIIKMFRSGQLLPDTLVWTEGLDQWTPARKIKDFVGLVFFSPPPIPTPTPTVLTERDFIPNSIENENKSKPFYKNANNAERKDWFSRTRPWHRIDSRLIDALIKRYDDDPMFGVFVVASMENDLVKEYETLDIEEIPPDIACSVISGTLLKHGSQNALQVINMINNRTNQKKAPELYTNAMNLLESSIIIDSNQIVAYRLLAILRGVLNKKTDALQFVQKGLEAIDHIQKSNVPFEKSSLKEIQQAPQHIEELKTQLLELKAEYS